MKRTLFRLFSILVVVASVFGAVSAAAADNGVQLTVTAAALNLRGGPGTNYPVLNVLHSGDTVQATGRDAGGGWYQVQLSDGSMGWVSGAYVQPGGDTSGLSVAAAPPAPAAALSPAATAGSRPGARTGASTLVFQTSSGGGIYVVSLDAQGNVVSGPRYLTDGMDPALSPDGRTVAFTRWVGGRNGAPGSLWVIGVDGSGLRKVLDSMAQPKSPSWSPDGTQIAINVQQGGLVEDLTGCLPLTGRGRPTLPPGAIITSASNDEICYRVPADPHWILRTVDVATGAFQDLPGTPLHPFAPTWDPADANRIVFTNERGLSNEYLTASDASALTQNPDQRGPVFSPDGRKIAISFRQDNHWEVHVLNSDGSGEVRLTETPLTVIVDQLLKGQAPVMWNNAAPAWSPDGSRIAFVTNRSGQWEIWIMNADGSNQRPLLTASQLGGLKIQYAGVDERVITWR